MDDKYSENKFIKILQKTIDKLEQENAELRKQVEELKEKYKHILMICEERGEQLANAIVPPIELGKQIFKIVFNTNNGEYDIYPYTVHYCDNKNFYTTSDVLIEKYKTHAFADFNKTYFLTPTEAIAALQAQKAGGK